MTARGRRLRVLLADDHVMVRSGIRELLARVGGVEVVGEAGDGREAVRLVEQLRPDIVLMDVSMRGLNGIEATRHIVRTRPHTRVLVLSAYAEEEYVVAALRAGAAGYLIKGADVAELTAAVRTVARGQTYLAPQFAKSVAEYQRLVSGDEPAARLTPRQREVAQLIAEGHTSREVARALGVSVKTVESHRTELMRRLGVRDVQGLVRYAIREGLVSAES